MKKIYPILLSIYYFILLKVKLLDDDIISLQKKRLPICNKCTLKNGIYCSKKKQLNAGPQNIKGCGCIFFLKTLIPKEKCPLKKW